MVDRDSLRSRVVAVRWKKWQAMPPASQHGCLHRALQTRRYGGGSSH